jgi:hypothetical protein
MPLLSDWLSQHIRFCRDERRLCKASAVTRLGAGDGPLVCGGAPPPSRARGVSFGNGLWPPLTAEPLHPLRSATKGQARARPDRTRAIPCNVRAVNQQAAVRGCSLGCSSQPARPSGEDWSSTAVQAESIRTAATRDTNVFGSASCPPDECRSC